jgi:hypothetical protein
MKTPETNSADRFSNIGHPRTLDKGAPGNQINPAGVNLKPSDSQQIEPSDKNDIGIEKDDAERELLVTRDLERDLKKAMAKINQENTDKKIEGSHQLNTIEKITGQIFKEIGAFKDFILKNKKLALLIGATVLGEQIFSQGVDAKGKEVDEQYKNAEKRNQELNKELKKLNQPDLAEKIEKILKNKTLRNVFALASLAVLMGSICALFAVPGASPVLGPVCKLAVAATVIGFFIVD